MDVRNLLSSFDPVKEYLIAALLLAIAIGAFAFIHHERTIGAQKLANDIAKRDLQWQAKVNKVEQNAATQIGQLKGQLLLASVTPRPNPIVVRVCDSSADSTPVVPPSARPGEGSDAKGRPGAGVASAGEGVDIGAPTEALLNRLDAKIKYLQGYILACQEAGDCAR